MHPIQKLWNLATGLKKANVEFKVFRERMTEALPKLGIYDDFDWVEMAQFVNTSLSTGETWEDFYDPDDADTWVMPSVPDFTQPSPHVDQQTGEILDESPGPKKKTKATEKVDTIKLMIVKYLSVVPENWYSAREVAQLFKGEVSEKTIKRYLEDLLADRQVTRKNEYQRISATKTTKRHLYKFCPATAVK